MICQIGFNALPATTNGLCVCVFVSVSMKAMKRNTKISWSSYDNSFVKTVCKTKGQILARGEEKGKIFINPKLVHTTTWYFKPSFIFRQLMCTKHTRNYQNTCGLLPVGAVGMVFLQQLEFSPNIPHMNSRKANNDKPAIAP